MIALAHGLLAAVETRRASRKDGVVVSLLLLASIVAFATKVEALSFPIAVSVWHSGYSMVPWLLSDVQEAGGGRGALLAAAFVAMPFVVAAIEKRGRRLLRKALSRRTSA